MWWRTAWPKTRSKRGVRQRQLLGVARDGRDVEPEAARVALQHREHAGRDVAAHGAAHHAGLQQVEREVARAGADLQRAREGAGLAAERLAQLRHDLSPTDGAEVDSPLGVVLGGGRVVVAGVDVADLGRCPRGAHRARNSSVHLERGDRPYTRPRS